MQSEIIPSEVQFVAPPSIPQARSYLFRQQSELLEYDVNKGQKVQINIPRLQRSYLMKDSYLRFRLNIDFTPSATAQKLYFDRCGAHGLFDRIEVYDYLGGTLLEQTQNVPALVTLLNDLDQSFCSYNGKLQALEQMEGCNVQPTAILDIYEIRTSPVGATIYNNETDTNAKFFTVEVCLPIMSFLGVYSDKYAPLHNGYTVNFYLNSPQQAFISRSSNSDTTAQTPVQFDQVWLSNIELCCQVLELGETAESLVTANQPMVIASKQYRYFSDTILGNGLQSSLRLDMNLNVVSLRNIRWGMRPAVYQNNLVYPSTGYRIRNFLRNWNFQYGSSYLPEIAGITSRANSVPVSRQGVRNYVYSSGAGTTDDYYKALGYNQAYMELIKTIDFPYAEIAINRTEYAIDLGCPGVSSNTKSPYMGPLTGTDAIIPFPITSVAGSLPSIAGKFAAGLDTRLSRKSAVSGIDTNGLQLTLNAEFDQNNVTNMTQAIIDVWAEHDAFVQIIPGVATTVTF